MHKPMSPGAGGVLIASQAAPDLSTAYARVGRELAIQLSHHRPVHLVATHGNVASEYTLSEGAATVPVHPYPWAYFVASNINRLARDINAELVVWVGDAWPFASQLAGAAREMPWVLMAPVDHVPLVAPEVALARVVAAWASPTRWGAEAVRAAGGREVYVPHGVSEAFRHAGAQLGTRENARARLGWAGGVTRYLSVGGNVGDRKNLAGLLRAWRDAALPDAELVLWCYPTRDDGNPDGLDLLGAARELGVNNVRFPEPYRVSVGYPDADLAAVYMACDVLVQVSKTEGFGIPIAEAQALGTPAIVTRYAPFLEVAGAVDDAYTVPIGTWELMQLLGTAWMPCPSHDGIVDALRQFHRDGIRPEELGRRTHYARGYTWPIAAAALNAAIAQIRPQTPEIEPRALAGALSEGD
jgi:glycosyltransferase involved in cell wall biosynthesis